MEFEISKDGKWFYLGENGKEHFITEEELYKLSLDEIKEFYTLEDGSIDLSNIDTPFALPDGLVIGEIDLRNSNCFSIGGRTEVGIIYLEGSCVNKLPDDLKCQTINFGSDTELASHIKYQPNDVADITVNQVMSEGKEISALLGLPTAKQILAMEEKEQQIQEFIARQPLRMKLRQ